MAEIVLDNIAHSYDGREYALKPMSMTWDDGRAYALLGPSGCGKTTLLNIVSGLLRPSEGRVLIDGVDVTDTPTTRRNIAQVFQFPVLYETMTVRGNLDFPLRNRGVDKATRAARVDEVADLLGLTDMLDEKPGRLRADLQQIVSLGRGLVRDDVAAVLFDEPLTVIDPNAKWELRSRLKVLHGQTGYTLIYVTHDQTEALTFADEVVLMQDGEVMQTGTPTDLFLEPAHEFVGHFIGSPGMNFLDADLQGGVLRVGDQELRELSAPADLASGPIRIGVRPEFLSIADTSPTPEPAGGLAATAERIDRRGSHTLVHASVSGQSIIARVDVGTAPRPGAAITLLPDPRRTYLFRDGAAAGHVSPDPIGAGS